VINQVGAMRNRIRLRKPVRIVDELGGTVIVFADEADVWAEIAAIDSSIGASADANAALTRFRATINRRADIRVGWRVGWNARSLRVVGVRDDGSARIDLVCEEEVL
jgi:SPP1 family predicted phage head-tail adaptor